MPFCDETVGYLVTKNMFNALQNLLSCQAGVNNMFMPKTFLLSGKEPLAHKHKPVTVLKFWLCRKFASKKFAPLLPKKCFWWEFLHLPGGIRFSWPCVSPSTDVKTVPYHSLKYTTLYNTQTSANTANHIGALYSLHSAQCNALAAKS